MSENKIPTAEELILERVGTRSKWVEELMIEFAKLHCEAQLKAILENVETKEEYWNGLDGGQEVSVVDEASIINAYDLNQIK